MTTYSAQSKDIFKKIEDITAFKSVVAEAPAVGVSSKYAFIPTSRVLTTLADFNWHPVSVAEHHSRKAENQGFQGHAIMLRNTADMACLEMGHTIPQLMLTNNHAGTGSFKLSLALYRKACMNGLMVKRGDLQNQTVRHIGFTDDKVAAAIAGIVPHVSTTMDMVEQFSNLQLDADERRIFATSAIDLRWDGEAYSVDPMRMLMPKRSADRANDLYTTLNVVQEHIIRGGVGVRNTVSGSPAYGQQRRATAVKGLDTNIRLNRALWTLTERMAELKGIKLPTPLGVVEVTDEF